MHVGTVAAADPHSLVEVLGRGDLKMAEKLVGSGIDANNNAAEVIHSLTWHTNNRYFFKHLMQARMRIGSENYAPSDNR